MIRRSYEESEFEFMPNSACKKTAVFQNTKMADYREKDEGQKELEQQRTADRGDLKE